MPYEVTNPGPWEHWPVSGHVVDAEGNTVCTIAPDCSPEAVAVISKAPEVVKTLGELLIEFSAMMLGDAMPTDEEAAVLMEQIKQASELMSLFMSNSSSKTFVSTDIQDGDASSVDLSPLFTTPQVHSIDPADYINHPAVTDHFKNRNEP